LKQRREISAGTAYYIDQSAVRAASHGRILVLEGIEKVRRQTMAENLNLKTKDLGQSCVNILGA
jgi:hypothetical protein